MKTFIYLVRHGESLKTEGNERTRGLTDKGKSDAVKITELLRDEGINTLISSPYRRAVLTIEDFAHVIGKDILVFEDLREMSFSSEDKVIADPELIPLVQKMFSDSNYSLPGGESLTSCRNRIAAILKEILQKYRGQKVVVGTHGIVMTLMLGFFDSRYDFHFLMQTSKPDIYRMEFHQDKLVEIKRLWRDYACEGDLNHAK